MHMNSLITVLRNFREILTSITYYQMPSRMNTWHLYKDSFKLEQADFSEIRISHSLDKVAGL